MEMGHYGFYDYDKVFGNTTSIVLPYNIAITGAVSLTTLIKMMIR